MNLITKIVRVRSEFQQSSLKEFLRHRRVSNVLSLGKRFVRPSPRPEVSKSGGNQIRLLSLNRKPRDLCDSIIIGVLYFGFDLKFGNNDEGRPSSKIIELDRDQRSSGLYPDSEPYEREIFNDGRRKDRICAQCGQDHSSKQQFKDVKTSIEHIPKLFSLKRNMTEISTDNRNYDASYTQALICRHCGAPVIVEVTTKIYNLEPYGEEEKVEHGHPVDPDTICDAFERVATEVRLLDKWDYDDYIYFNRR